MDKDADTTVYSGGAAAAEPGGAVSGTSPLRRLGDAALYAWRWFRGFRRTRPFWGAVWLLLGGYRVLNYSMVGTTVMFSAGLTGFGGWLSGGGMLVCGAVAMFFPSQRFFAGIIGLLLAIASLVISNLGAFFIGMLLGVIGSAMILAWGPKRAPGTGVFFRRGKKAPAGQVSPGTPDPESNAELADMDASAELDASAGSASADLDASAGSASADPDSSVATVETPQSDDAAATASTGDGTKS